MSVVNGEGVADTLLHYIDAREATEQREPQAISMGSVEVIKAYAAEEHVHYELLCEALAVRDFAAEPAIRQTIAREMYL